MSLLCLMMFAACSSDDEIVENDENGDIYGEEFVISVDMPDKESTRVKLDGWNLTWEQDDKLVLIARDAQNNFIGPSDFKLISGADKTKAKFVGRAVKKAAKYEVYYKSKNLKLDRSGNEPKVYMDYSNVVQEEMNSSEHVKNYLLMTAPAKTKEELMHANFALDIKTSLLVIDIKAVPYNVNNANKVSWYINYDNPGWKWEMGSLNFKGTIKKNEHNRLYMPFVVDKEHWGLYTGQEIALVFTNGAFKRSVVAKATKNMQYKEGYEYTVNVSVPDDKDAGHALTEWNGTDLRPIAPLNGPAKNEIWVKFVDDNAAQKVITDDYGTVFTLSPKVEKGWHAYKTASAITETSKIFQNNKNITDVYLPFYLVDIPDNMFEGCTNLLSVRMSPFTEFIGNNCFYQCYRLRNVEIPVTVMLIKAHAFAGLHSGTEITDNFDNTRFIVHSHIDHIKIENAIFHEAKTEQPTILYIHESWKESIKDNTWQGVRFKEVRYLVDGDIVNEDGTITHRLVRTE